MSRQTNAAALELALEKARYEVARAQRQYDLVDPANRLVAGELEQRWNGALTRVAELEAQLGELDCARVSLSEAQQRRLCELGEDLDCLWNHPSRVQRTEEAHRAHRAA